MRPGASEPRTHLRDLVRLRIARLRASAEHGFTIVELLVYITLGGLVFGATLSFLITTLLQQNGVSSRAVSSRQAELVLGRITRELREAQRIEDDTGNDETPVNVTYGSGSSSVSFYLPDTGSDGVGTQVTWSCSAGGSCTRTAGGSTVTVITGVSSANFMPIGPDGSTLASNAGTGSSPSYPASVQMTLSVKDISQLDSSQSTTVSGVTNPITVSDGAALRNYSG